MPNEICYVELITSDIKQATDFYHGVFGWAVTPSGENYAMFNPGAEPTGGFSPPMPGISSGVCMYIHVADIADALQKIVAAGGEQVAPRTRISDDYGCYALFRDPGGNVVGIWSEN